MQGIEFLEQFLDTSDWFLGVEKERYWPAYRAISLPHRDHVNFLFDWIAWDKHGEAQDFFDENKPFPSASGKTLAQALRGLSDRLFEMYRVTDQGLEPKFKIIAERDT
jgi:hypothetical protein